MDNWLFVQQIIDSIESSVNSLSTQSLAKLRVVFPQKTIVSALDLIDNDAVIEYTTPWGRPEYNVRGTTATYQVILDLTAGRVPFCCTCPAFANYVLNDAHLTCKHILATLLARQLSACVVLPLTDDVLARLFQQQVSLEEGSEALDPFA